MMLFNYIMSNLKISFLIFILLIASLFISCSEVQSSKSNKEMKADSILVSLVDKPNIQNGYKAYMSYGCILCHGVNGEGHVKNKNAQTAEEIPSLTYVAEGFTKKEFKQRVLKGVSRIARLDSMKGVPPLAMPGWSNMQKNTLKDLTSYVWNLYPQDEEDDW